MLYKHIKTYSIDYNGDLFVSDGDRKIYAYFDLTTAQFKRKCDDTPILPTEMRITSYAQVPKQVKIRP